MIAVILPSRGLMYSRTAEEILKNLKGLDYKIFFSHRKPIPECFNEPTEQALANPDVTHLWFVEDDMILPPTILQDMLDKDKAAVTVNYPTTKNRDAAILTIKNRIVYGGTGCLLVKRAVFDELPKPIWRTDIVWTPKNMGNFIKFTAIKRDKPTGYGYHDVNFYINLYRLDIPVHKLDYTIGQRKLVAMGKSGSNNGAHQIEEWHKVKKDRYFTLRKNLPKPDKEDKMTTVLIGEREYTCSRDHAKKIIKAGHGKKPPYRAVVFDDLAL